MISVVYFVTPSFSHDLVWRRPSMQTCLPLDRYSWHISASLPNAVIRCHSVRFYISPVFLSLHFSEVAMLNFAMRTPSWVRMISGSLPRFPIKITLFIFCFLYIGTWLFYRRSLPVADPGCSRVYCNSCVVVYEDSGWIYFIVSGACNNLKGAVFGWRSLNRSGIVLTASSPTICVAGIFAGILICVSQYIMV